jgi:predicted metal-dependent peptidase
MQTIDTVAVNAAERVSKARQELILERTFYGVLVSQVEALPSRDFPTMATNGKQHFFNPDFIAGLSQLELLAVQAHETEHDARRHHTRRGHRDPQEWNIACDYAINPDLIKAGFKLPEDALLDWRFEGMSAEDIFRTRELERQQEQPPQQPQPQEGDGEADEDDDAGKPGDDGNEGDQPADGTDGDEGAGEAAGEAGEQPGGEGTAPGNGDAGEPGSEPGEGSGEGEGSEAGSDAGQAKPQPSSGDPGRCGEVLDAAPDAAERADEDAKWERVVREAASLARKRGDAPGHVSREIERNDHPPQDWRETLRAFFDGGAQTTETWSRPNRRFIGGGLYLPGREREGVNRAAFLVDTSGSMDRIALAAIGMEVQAALDESIIDEVVVIYGDTRVTRVDTYRPGDECEFDPRGGGGTMLMPLFEHVANEVDASLIVCFTDGEHEITSEHDEPACPVLWALTGFPDRVRRHMANAPWDATAIDVGSH